MAGSPDLKLVWLNYLAWKLILFADAFEGSTEPQD